MTLVILGHTDSNTSMANRAVIQTLQQCGLDMEVRDIGKLYPDYKVDVVEEQSALMRYDLIIFQHPMYWFNLSSILQSWIEQVFVHGFAYGSQGNKLKNKKLLESITIGQKEENIKHVMQSLSSIIEKTAQYSKMEYLGAFPLYDIATLTGNTQLDIERKAKIHGEKIYNFLQNLD